MSWRFQEHFWQASASSTGSASYSLTFDEVLSPIDLGIRDAAHPMAEGVTTADVRLLQAGKLLTEVELLTDLIQKAAGKSDIESTTLSDSRILDASKPLNELLGTSDARTSGVSHTMYETLTLSDVVAAFRVILLTLTESLTLSETLSRLAGKLAAEGATLTDVRSAAASHLLDEAQALSDGVAKACQKTYPDALALVDLITKQPGKALPEGATLTDGRPAFSVGKAVIEAATLADSQTRFVGHLVSEILTLLDSLTSSTVTTFDGFIFMVDDALVTPEMLAEAVSVPGLSDPTFDVSDLANELMLFGEMTGEALSVPDLVGEGLIP